MIQKQIIDNVVQEQVGKLNELFNDTMDKASIESAGSDEFKEHWGLIISIIKMQCELINSLKKG